MTNNWKIFIGSILFMVLGFYYISIMRKTTFHSKAMAFKPRAENKKLAIDTPACQIPLLDPMHPSVAHLIERKAPLNCKQKKPAPVLPGDNITSPSIKLFRENLKAYGSDITCHYSSLFRKSEHRTTVDKKEVLINNEEVAVTDEFVKVNCINPKNKKTVYVDFFPFIQKKKSVEERCSKTRAQLQKTKSGMDERLSVLILGIDSVSKNQYLRHMKKTQTYLEKNVNYIEMMGYNRIGKNTYPNLVALLTGHLEDEVPDTSKAYANALPLIWNDFSKAGYRTLFSEDIPTISTFNFARNGFKDQPTDYYLRPFNVAVESSIVISKGKRGCFNGRLEVDVVLDWTADFFDAFPNDPLFALTFLTRLSHDDLNELSLQDEPYMRFIKRLNDRGHLNRTVVFFLSDHGFRFGSIRSTYIGRIEQNLPFLFVLVPPWLSVEYPDMYGNLKTNAHRLASPLDIYATMQTIKDFPQNSTSNSSKRSVSLLRETISENRTCNEANISNQFCSCIRMKQVSPKNEHVVKSAQKLLNSINEKTKSYRNICAEYSLVSVIEATIQLVHLGEDLDEKVSSNYRVTFEVKPGKGVFEGTVFHLVDKKDSYSPHSGIERINIYGQQSACINTAALKPFCFCH